MSQKGFSTLLLLVAILVVAGVAVFAMVAKNTSTTTETAEVITQPVATFKPMEETKDTPQEINNESVEDMDKIFIDIEKSAPQDDLSDINL